MTDPENEKQGLLERFLPERRIYIKTGEDHTRYYVLGPFVQLGFAVTGFAAVAWTIVASSAVVLNMMSADNAAHQAKVLQTAYEDRIALLSQERDLRAREAGAVQARFRLAMEEIADGHAELLRLGVERQELATALGLMRGKLANVVEVRDLASTERDALNQELDDVVGDLETRLSSETELASTLETITSTLGSTVRQRDATAESLQDLEQELAQIQFEAQLAADRQERMFTQLEDAVSVALDPLEKLLSTTGRDVEDLVTAIREQYSGEGGPFIPAHLGGYEDDPVYNRYKTLMGNLDRAHLMQIAAFKIPFASPVRQTVRFTSGFGRRRDPITGGGRMHNGQDLAGKRGTPIHTTGDGIVIFAGRQSGYGNVIKVRHGFGYETVYAHLNSMSVKTGDTVSRGDVIGGMGNTGRSTGTHLHYEIRIGGTPVNPMPYMKAARNVF